MRFPTLVLGAAAALLVARPATLVHTKLVKAEPGIDATVATAPKQIRLWWSDRTDAALTSATLLKADRSPVGVIKFTETDDSLSSAGAVPVDLAPGKYLVMYKTAAHDGHVVRGTFGFTFDPAAKP
ncbi:MAG: copper resistance protein CopC [Gemmatimonadetes bacterium]|nr:copper resistance protein CopC [Gemmatimonadota bacterium]